MNEMIPVVRITPGYDLEGSPYIVALSPQHSMDLLALFDGAETGEWYRFEYVQMAKDEYDALPEFTGF